MASQPNSSARLFVLRASNAPIAVILRRGPSDWVQMIHWDTKRDIFTPGQWFHGRIYEHKCDISPNGQYFVYDAWKPNNRLTNPDYGDRWTAICKPPYFTALALWPHQQRIGGGGYFKSNKELLLNHYDDNVEAHPSHQAENLEVVPAEKSDFMGNSVSYYRMVRDGWKRTAFNRPHPRLPRYFKGLPPANLTRPSGIDLQKWLLRCQIGYRYRPLEYRAIYHRKGLFAIVPEYHYRITHSWYYRMNEARVDDTNLPDVTWADHIDKRGIIIAKGGKLLIAKPTRDEVEYTELADFNGNTPESVDSPAWAKTW